MDQKDQVILDYLMERGRDKIADISRKVDIPRITVYERIKSMEERGIIRKFTVIPDYKQIGLPVVAFVFIQYDPKSGRSQREVALEISHLKFVYEVHIVAGQWDMLIKVRVPDNDGLGNLVLDKLRAIRGIEKTETISVFSSLE